MNSLCRQIGVLVGALTLGSGAFAARPLAAQTSLPATAPTAVTPSQLPSANPPVTHNPTGVQWDGHLLRITASGESLNEVLREVATRAGVHISGNLPQDAIYGTYGPEPLADVLSELVAGLSVNMLFVDRIGNKPAELTFTARNGAATPPDPTASQAAFAPQQPPQPYAPPQPPPNPGVTTPNTPNGGAGLPASAAQTADGNANPTSPNGVKTPQEIFEQLRRLRATAAAQKQ